VVATVVAIVEGFGEVDAVPALIGRIADVDRPELALRLPKPIRVPRGRLLKDGELERYAELAAGQVGDRGGVLVLIDADDDCPAVLGPALAGRLGTAIGHVPSGVVLAKYEFENWFLAGAESLRGTRGLPADLTSPIDPEAIRGAKEWIAGRMPVGRGYSETVDQAALVRQVDVPAARGRSRSLDKCWREVCKLLDGTRAPQ
jgi:hypothetical protein